jgi:hypothetical protein
VRVSSPADFLARLSVLFYGGMAVLALGWMAWRGHLGLLAPSSDAPIAGRGWPADACGGVALGLFVALAVVVVTRGPMSSGSWSEFLEDRMREALQGIRPPQAIALALLSGVGEELLFRGVLQVELGAWLGTFWGWLLASLIFGAVHTGPDRRFLLWSGFSAVVGMLLGGLLWATGSLLAPIALHIGVNGMNLLIEAWEERLRGVRSVASRPQGR